jgi:hypothetical protein
VASQSRTAASRASKLLPLGARVTPTALRHELARHQQAVEEQGSRGPAGNARLTAATGVVLLALLAIEGLTLVSLRPLLPVHVFVGMLLIPPIALKIGSTGYRFVRYYTHDRAYLLAGPPRALMRVLGPFVIAATVVLFGSGVAMLALGPGRNWIVGLHKASFVAWLLVVAAHVLGHLVHIPGLASADFRGPRARRPGAPLRQGAVAASLVTGLVLAIATVHYAAPWRIAIG